MHPTLALAALLLLTPAAHATPLSLSFSDPTAAQSDPISVVGDVTSVLLTFDPATGAYTADWTADLANPFTGHIRLNLNLGNAAVSQDPVSLFAEYTSLSPTTHLSYTGSDPALTLWHLGDTIVTAGGPPTYSSLFNSGDVNLDNLTTTDRDIIDQSALITDPAIPEPATLALLVLAATLLPLTRRRTPLSPSGASGASGGDEGRMTSGH